MTNEISRKRWLSAGIIPIVFFYLCEFRFFYLIPLPAKLVAGSTNRVLIAMFSVALFIVWLALNKKFRFGYFGKAFIMVFAVVSVSTILSAFEFGYKMTQVLWGIIPYFILFLFFPAKKYLSDKDTMERFIVIGEVSVIVMTVLFLVQYRRYVAGGSFFLKLVDMIDDHYLWHPEEGMRIRNVFDGFSRVFAIVIADRILEKKFKHCILDIVAYVALIAAILIIDKSRLYLLIVLFSSISILIYRARKRITAPIFLIGSVAILGGIGVMLVKFSSIISSISDNSGSWYARVGGSVHFLKIGLEHFFFGIGMADHEAIKSVEKYVRGIEGIYYPDDVGIIGVFALTGILGLVLYIFLIAKVFKCFKCARTNKPLLFGLFICILTSSVLSSYFDRTRLMALVFTAVLCEINSHTGVNEYEFNYIDRL